MSGDAAYVRDVVTGLDRPVLLVGHSYAGVVITEAASADPAVLGLVYVAAFAPDHGESALELSTTYPGSSLGESLPPCATKPLGGGPQHHPAERGVARGEPVSACSRHRHHRRGTRRVLRRRRRLSVQGRR
ncbi:alpha/beta fold hydrolase [Mumia sp. zg.B17]|uniref:alpha/beta fold hydrolase n=1 Tax=Mumia sp. zg.B17 TaxID=2855446 RepID=UPI001C6E85B9|nr:alpha/beta fold hydrolase [Mumia sp. zg.B17]MBW9205796.1 alpha/beta fold hydrolase [Mumia sp. zg.B17]